MFLVFNKIWQMFRKNMQASLNCNNFLNFIFFSIKIKKVSSQISKSNIQNIQVEFYFTNKKNCRNLPKILQITNIFYRNILIMFIY